MCGVQQSPFRVPVLGGGREDGSLNLNTCKKKLSLVVLLVCCKVNLSPEEKSSLVKVLYSG